MTARIYDGDFVFRRMLDEMLKRFVQHIQSKFEISMVDEPNYFLGFQYKPMKDVIFISQAKRIMEYISAERGQTQFLWIKQMSAEYVVKQDVMTLFCSNVSTINFKHSFIREPVEDKKIALEYIHTEKQLANIFTKALDASRFECLRSSLGQCSISL